LTILFAYDGSENADAGIAAAGKLIDHHDRADAVVPSHQVRTLDGGRVRRPDSAEGSTAPECR
jgi:hypothetical protein